MDVAQTSPSPTLYVHHANPPHINSLTAGSPTYKLVGSGAENLASTEGPPDQENTFRNMQVCLLSLSLQNWRIYRKDAFLARWKD